MRCDDVHLALSARLDGEAETQPPAAVDAHLAGCPGCRSWLARAERVTRAVRLQAVAVPDLTERILTVAHAQGALPSSPSAETEKAGSWLRWVLGGLAVVQLMLAVPDLLGAAGHEAHAGREVAAFDIALAVGLLIAAWYPEHARIFAPVVLTLVVCFGAISALDVMQGVVSPGRVAVHAISVVQAGLLWRLARQSVPHPNAPAPHSHAMEAAGEPR
jgi:predicted anti-sigma-YlaC factor YlaD